MSELHLDAQGCRASVLEYRRELRQLLNLLRDAESLGEAHPARSALDRLRERLEADVRNRSTLEGQGAMTVLEARVLEPALRQARIALAVSSRAPAAEWLAHLQAADACFLVALSRLNDASPRAPARAAVPPGPVAPGYRRTPTFAPAAREWGSR